MSDVRKLAKIVSDHSRQIKGLSGGPQAAYSSIEGGSMDSYDSDGKLRLRIGAQDDGTQGVKYVQGPPPPRPTAPVVSVDGPVVRVRWDGMLLGGHIPEDFSRIDVHFALSSDDLEDEAAVRGNLATSAGNETVLAATQTGTYRVGLVAMSQSRARSEMSDVTEVEVELVNLKGALDAVVDNASGGSNHYSPEPPSGTDHDPDRDLWFDTSEDPETGLTAYTPHRWDGQEWVSLEDERTQAIKDAQDALEADVDRVRTSVDGKNAVTQSTSTPPNQYDGATGDIWERMSSMGSGGRSVSRWRWNGDVWVPNLIGDTVLGNVDAAKIGTGYLDANRIKAGTIQTDMLAVGLGGNLLYDPKFLDPDVSATRLGNSDWTWRDRGGRMCFERQMPNPGSNSTFNLTDPSGNTEYVPVSPGVKVVVEVEALGPVDIIPSFRYADGIVGVGSAVADWDAEMRVVRAEINPDDYSSWKSGAGASHISIALRQRYSVAYAPPGTWTRVFSARIAPMSGATVIEGGAITTEKIAVGAITAESGIVGSLDAGVITVGEMNGARIEAGTIDTPQLAFGAATGDVLSVDALNFKRAVGLDLSAPSIRVGDAMELTEDFGIRQFGPDGALNVSLPSDGSPAEFRGDLSARTLTATGRMSIQGPGAIASGGVLELESGVVPPVAGPQITNTWDRTTFPPLTEQEAPAGLAWADGHFWRCVTTSVGLSEGGRTRIEKITPTGELVGGWDTTFRVSVDGITILNDEIYVLAWGLSVSGDSSTPTRPRMVVVYDLQGVEKRRWEYPNYGSGTWQPGIGTDGLNIVIAQSWANGDHTYRTFNVNTGALVRRYDTGFQMRSNVTQILFGDFDYADGRKKIIAQQRTDLKAFVCYNSAETAPDDAGRSWNAADFQNPVGLVWDGARFHSLTPAGDLVSYEPHEPGRFVGDDEGDWWGAATWATGSQETTAGPATRFRYLHRAQLRRQNGDVPEGVEQARFYLAKGSTEPARTSLHWVATSTPPQEPSRIMSISSSWATGANPPAANSFTTDEPGLIRSALGTFEVDGTGAGAWGPLDFHADGTMTGKGTVITGRVDHPSVEHAFGHGVTVTFPAGRFSRPPRVMLTSSIGRISPAADEALITKDSFRIGAWNYSGVASGVSTTYWAAIDEGA